MKLKKNNKAIFLDRDGTLNINTEYVNRPSDVKLIENVPIALKIFKSLGFLLICVTNQSGIARGYFTIKDLKSVNKRLQELLKKEGVTLDRIYFCPYHKDGKIKRYAIESPCRKPKPGMLIKAAKDFNIDLSSSYMIGDSISDVEAGFNAGVKGSILISSKDKNEIPKPSATVKDLLEASEWILLNEQRQKIIKNPEELEKRIKLLKKEGKIIVMTNGTFDIIHPGHINFLKLCKAMGDILVVGLNSDLSVKKYKGETRPVISEKDRAEMLCSFDFVDFVFIFNERDPRALIRIVKPHIHVKDANYKKEDIIEYDEVIRYKGKVVTLPRIGNYSTSAILNKLKKI